jgi:hypothetical protein
MIHTNPPEIVSQLIDSYSICDVQLVELSQDLSGDWSIVFSSDFNNDYCLCFQVSEDIKRPIWGGFGCLGSELCEEFYLKDQSPVEIVRLFQDFHKQDLIP